jgi:eukaryotic-like serine/threonine-protein kinase
MTPQRWTRIEQLFEAASGLNADARAALLDRECAGDAMLRDEIEGMLVADTASTATIRDAVAAGKALAQEHVAAGTAIGRRFGAYRVTAVLGYGGMGAVYLANRDDQVYTNEVAIKALRHDFVEGPQARDRFRQERQILAGLSHPNIARLLDGGEDPAPYLVMERIEGIPLTRYCEGRSVEERLRLFLGVCDAVQYAHSHLVVHRDLKPSNILVTAQGVPKLLDFGIAKLLPLGGGSAAAPGITQTGVRMFTPEYASPEQFRGQPISTATDIYSLGAVLYHLLADVPPHQLTNMSPGEMEETITAVQPVRPSAAAPAVRRHRLAGDLDNIVLMALRKEPERRYASALALAEDIRRHLDGRPVLARAATIKYRSAKFLRRHALAVTASCLIAFSLVLGLAVALYEARLARHRYRDVRQLTNRLLFDFDDSIKNLPGATHSRELVVQTGLMYLDRLYNDSSGDIDLIAELAAAYSKIGDVQGSPSMPSLGRSEDALASYARARELWGKVIAARPNDSKALRALADVYFVTGDLLRVTGRSMDSGRMFAEGAVIATTVLRTSPGDPDFIFTAGGAWLRSGDYHMVVNQLERARDDFHHSLELYQRAEALAPQGRYRNAVAIALSRCGLAASDTDRLAEARAFHDQSLAIRQELVAANPDAAVYRRGLASELLLAGAIFSSSQSLNLNDPETAIGYFRRGMAIQQSLAQADSANRTTQADLVIDNMRLCETLALVRPAEALPYCKASLEIGDVALVIMWRDDVNQYLALTDLGDAMAHLALKDYPTARKSAESALARIEKSTAKFIGIPYNRMRAYTYIGDAFAAEGDVAHAREAYEKARTVPFQPAEMDLMKVRQLAWIAQHSAELPGEDRCARYREAAGYWEQWKTRGGGAPPSAPMPAGCAQNR